MFGICLSLCANIAAAPKPSMFSVAVAACLPLPLPLPLLLAAELLNRALKRNRAETVDETTSETDETDETASVVRLASVPA
ncbi:diacylglycerol kinase [Nocardia sp. GAS34]|uniref:hypothetical protein n=1 Tax=unclassified Nocardia TaxID=2637762 RepID=UPI003D21AF9F